ncbi:hypothetical protein OMP38_31325 [Cohnella ginsengisoli]|uniref:Uncharacterized protein n=1 Tax=Cohnella ginsengisoli TaxID=425004 RepID=A0A9X4KSI5_9BACL|nr:hypothetical protein [Cohnella ginsengisoli]MDG0794820.1 hypothetical protein [Cohnella ginsengisoli]
MSNIVGSGWDFRVFAVDNEPDVSICTEKFTGQTQLAYAATNNGLTKLNAIQLSSSDGKLFDLRSVDLIFDDSGNETLPIQLVGYRNGSPVSGAVLTQNVQRASPDGEVVPFVVSGDAEFRGD